MLFLLYAQGPSRERELQSLNDDDYDDSNNNNSQYCHMFTMY